MIIPINNVLVDTIKTYSVNIVWDTTLPGTSQIEYGTTTLYGNFSTEDSLAYFHVTTLIGLSEGTLYHFRIKTKDYNGIESVSSDYAFITRTQAELDAVIRAARLDGGLPKSYYVSNTIGSDSNNGLAPMSPWKTLSYSTSKLDAGDTLYLLNDTWTDDRLASFSRSGVDVAPITVKAYPGANPVMAGLTSNWGSSSYYGVFIKNNSYIIIEDIEFHSYYSGIAFYGSHNTINNVYIHDTNGQAVHLSQAGQTWNTIQNSIIYNAGTLATTDNGIQITGKKINTGDPEAQYITVKNNTISNVPYHNGIDLYGTLRYITIDGNDITDIGNILIGNPHDYSVDYQQYLTIKNNNLHDNSGQEAVNLFATHNSLVYNNIITNITSPISYTLRINTNSDTILSIENKMYNSQYAARITSGNGHYFIRNYFTNSGSMILSSGTSATFIDNTGNISLTTGTNTATIQYDDNTVFTTSITGAYSILTPITYTPTRSYMVIQNTTTTTIQPIKYAMTVRPLSGTATVIVNSFNTALPKGSILASFSATGTGNIDFTVSTLKPNTGYMVNKSGVPIASLTTDSIGKISFTDTSGSFTIVEGLSGPDTTPPSITLVTTTVPDQVKVVYSEPVEELSSTNIANYAINNGITIYSISLGTDLMTVILTTSAHVEGTTYTITINNVVDRASPANTIVPNSQMTYQFVDALIISGITAASGKAYTIDTLAVGKIQYIDRTFTFSKVPSSYLNFSYIRTANDDKAVTTTNFLEFDVTKDVTVYVAHDDRITTKPSWLSLFIDNGDNIISEGGTFSLFTKNYSAGHIILGGNEGGNNSMYTPIISDICPPMICQIIFQ